MPDAKAAIEVVKGRVVLVDGTITPCWSYEDHPELWSRKHATTGFNAQLLSLLDGTAVYMSDPLPGKTHDAKAFIQTPVEEIVEHSGGGYSIPTTAARTAPTATPRMLLGDCSSSRSHGVLNNLPTTSQHPSENQNAANSWTGNTSGTVR
ncbi:MAG TPA: transposase family protein [Kineosporiaceae bacterium]